MATKLHAANSLRGMYRNLLAIQEVTTAGTFNSAYTSQSIQIPVGNGIIATPVFPVSVTNYYFHAECAASGTNQNNSSGAPWLQLLDSAGTVVFKLVYSSLGNIIAQYWNGSGYTNSGSTFLAPWFTTGLALSAIDLNVVCGASGSWTLSVAGSPLASGSIASASVDNIARLYLGNLSQQPMQWSQIKGADYDHSTEPLMFSELNGDSAANAGQLSGTYADLDTVPINDSTFVAIGTSGNKAGFTHTGITIPGGYYMSAMCLGAKMRRTSTISDGLFGVRSGSTNADGAALGMVGGYDVFNDMLDTDPVTSALWTQSTFNAAEPYLGAV